MQQRGVDLEAVGDLAHAVVEDGVARDPQHAVLLALPAQREADHVADDRMAQRRAVAARRRGDLDRGPVGRLEPGRLPRLEAARAAAQALRARGGRDDHAGRRQQRAAGGVEVVAVVVVAEQHRVDRRRGRSRRSPGPASLRDTVPQPKKYRGPGGSNVGSVSSRQPPTSIRTVGPPMWVRRTSFTPRPRRPRRVAHGPLQRVVGDLLPARCRGQQVRALELLDLGHACRTCSAWRWTAGSTAASGDPRCRR